MTDTQKYYQVEGYRFEEGVGFLVNRLAHAVTRELDRRMGELGLTDAQWKPLLMLHQGECSTAADLSRVACHDTGAVTRLLDRLEDKGLVQRQRSAEDRRVVHLELTAAGAQVAADVPKIIVGLANQVLSGFSPDEFEQFKTLLKRALHNATTASVTEAP